MQRLKFAALMLVAALTAGCGDSSVFESASGSDLTGEVRIRALNAAPGAPALDVLINNERIADAIGYATLPAGSYQVRVTSVGSPDVLVDTGAVELADGNIRTVVVLETAAGGPPYSAVILNDKIDQ